MGWGCDVEDVGGYMADADMAMEEADRVHSVRLDILKDRERRVEKLIGRYIIVCNGWKSNKQVYLQDMMISNKGYWTQFMSNAKGFYTLQAAEIELKKFRLNNPNIALVDINSNLVFIK